MLKFLTFIILMTSISMVFAIELDDVRLLDVSTSEKSISIDRGEFDNYKAHDYAKFYLQIGDKDHPKIYLVGEGELVKAFPRKSYWYLKNITMPNLIYPQSHLLLLSTKNVTSGRVRKIQQRHVVFSEREYDDVDRYLLENKKGVPEKLILQEKYFTSSGELFEKEKPRESDLLIETYEKLQMKPTSEISAEYGDEISDVYFVGKRRVQLVDILNEDDKKLLMSMSNQYMQKNAKLKYGLTQGLYYNQENSGDREIAAKKLSIRSAYDDEKEEAKKRVVIDPRVSAKIKRDGINWSDDLDDATLRRYFISTGIAEERLRRERVLSEREGHEFMFHYAGSLSDHTTPEDQNLRSLGYLVGLSYDLHLSRATPDLKSWSLQFLIEYGGNNYDFGGINGTSTELTYGGILNYYFINNPLSLNKFMFELGVGLKTGQSRMTAPGLSQGYDYQIISTPVIQLLSKYRFHIGDLNEDTVKLGSAFHAGLIYEQKRLRTRIVPVDSIDGDISVNDIKFQIGMGFYF